MASNDPSEAFVRTLTSNQNRIGGFNSGVATPLRFVDPGLERSETLSSRNIVL